MLCIRNIFTLLDHAESWGPVAVSATCIIIIFSARLFREIIHTLAPVSRYFCQAFKFANISRNARHARLPFDAVDRNLRGTNKHLLSAGQDSSTRLCRLASCICVCVPSERKYFSAFFRHDNTIARNYSLCLCAASYAAADRSTGMVPDLKYFMATQYKVRRGQ